MRHNIEALLSQLEGAGIDLDDIAGAILDRLEKSRAEPLAMAADPIITHLDRVAPQRRRNPRFSPGERLKRELRRKGLPVVPFDAR